MPNPDDLTHLPAQGAFSAISEASWGEETFALGAHIARGEATFAVYSATAESILLEFYEQPTGTPARYSVWLVRNSGDNIWRAKLRQVPTGTLYGFRCWGPNWPWHQAWARGGSDAGFIADVDGQGNRFNPNKLLIDPYARELTHDRLGPLVSRAGGHVEHYLTGSVLFAGRARREHDTGEFAPKAVLLETKRNASTRPRLAARDAIIYEVHPRGMTCHPSASSLSRHVGHYPGFERVVDIPPEERGTYAGAARMAPYFKALGVTAIELLPVHETQNDDNPADSAGGNYWGYMTFGFFAPDRRYAKDQSLGGPTREFQQMVRTFHDHGMEVYLDVVFNHTGEGGNIQGRKDTVCFNFLGGFDREYYLQTPDFCLIDGATGCGNQVDYRSCAGRKLVMDSLRYWVDEMDVDGFRFDLATVLGRDPWTFQGDHPLLIEIRDFARQRNIELIAEAWDLWGTHVGRFPTQWAEWNSRYRDTVREFVCQRSGNVLAFIDVLKGDDKCTLDQGGPHRSVNFVAAHDGFTLVDLVSYSFKTNLRLEWPFGPSDGGSDYNRSSDSDQDQALRRVRVRSLWTLLMMSRGVPMVAWGDEMGRTQNGNNNPYNIDSVATWTNYAMASSHAPGRVLTGDGGRYDDNLGQASSAENRNPIFVLASYLMRMRRSHPVLRQALSDDSIENGVNRMAYSFRREDGVSLPGQGNRALMLKIDGSGSSDADFLLLINMHDQLVDFKVPPADSSHAWRRLIDTAVWAESDGNCWDRAHAQVVSPGHYGVYPSSVVVLSAG